MDNTPAHQRHARQLPARAQSTAERKLIERLSWRLCDAVASKDPQTLRKRIQSAAADPHAGSFRHGPAAQAGASAMWRACETRQPEMTQALLDAGFPPTHRRPEADNDGPIIWAAYHGDIASLRLLLKAGADPLCENDFGETPLTMAAKYGHDECVRALFEAGVPLGHGALSGHRPPLLAIAYGRSACLEAMLHQGLHPNQPLVDAHGSPGRTPLAAAAFHRGIDCARVLLAAGANPNLRDAEGIAPLMWATTNADIPMIQLLLSAGANPRIKTASAPSVWHRALCQPGLDCLDIAKLTENGAQAAALLGSAIAKLDIQDALGSEPLNIPKGKTRRI